MSDFFPKRYENLQGWIPETDSDGIDIGRKPFVADCDNIIFENGFIRCEEREGSLNTHIPPVELENEQKILKAIFFEHSRFGTVWIYLMHNTIDDSLYVYLHSSDGTQAVYMSAHKILDAYSPLEIADINFAVFGDSLRINTNVVLEFTDTMTGKEINEDENPSYHRKVYGNLVLYFNTKLNEWKLTPRWLGWNLYDGVKSLNIDTEEELVNINNNSSLYIEDADTTNPYPYTFYFNAISSSAANESKFIKFRYSSSIGEIRIEELSIASSTERAMYFYIAKVKQDLYNIKDDEVFWLHKIDRTDLGGTACQDSVVKAKNYIVKINKFIPKGYHLFIHYGMTDNFGCNLSGYQSIIKKLKIISLEGRYISLFGNFKKQRSMVFYDDIEKDKRYYQLFEDIKFKLPIDAWDERMHLEVGETSPLEFYHTVDNKNIYTKVEMEVSAITDSANYKEVTLAPIEAENNKETTLNFNYGLGASVPVFPIEHCGRACRIYGRKINDEIYYRNRSYSVNGDNKMYLSHIAGNGKLQADSFPYNEDIGYGYISENNSNEKFIALAISPLDEIVLYSDKKNLVYSIQPGQSMVYRKLKAVNGSSGIINPNTLTKDNTGRPLAEVVVWGDKDGLYIYGGGINAPKNVLVGQIINYWKKLDHSKMLFAYNKNRFEVLVLMPNEDETKVIYYNIYTNTFRKGTFDFSVINVLGTEEGKLYLFTKNNIIKYLNGDNVWGDYKDAFLETHYLTGYNMDGNGNIFTVYEDTDKILQKIDLSILEKIGNSKIVVTVIADGNIIEPSIDFVNPELFELRMAHLLLRYKKIKLRIWIKGSAIRVRTFGYRFSVLNTVHNTVAKLPIGVSIATDRLRF